MLTLYAQRASGSPVMTARARAIDGWSDDGCMSPTTLDSAYGEHESETGSSVLHCRKEVPSVVTFVDDLAAMQMGNRRAIKFRNIYW